uniref:Uncharacterized protein n=1 Tax=Arundo donax TaxID=35708 RepID=A0A0A8YWI5_ARUDO
MFLAKLSRFSMMQVNHKNLFHQIWSYQELTMV